MSIDSISGLFSTPKNYKPSATSVVQSIVGSLFSPKDTLAADSIASLSVATQLQAQGEGFRRITNNLSRTQSEVQIAEEGVAKIQSDLQELKDIARRARDENIDVATRQNLTARFRSVADRIDNVVNATKFGDQKLLNGNLSGKGSLSLEQQFAAPGVKTSGNGNNSLSIGDLSTNGLFGGEAINVDTVENAARAETKIDAAVASVTATLGDVKSFRAAVSHIAAHFETAAANQQAAPSLW